MANMEGVADRCKLGLSDCCQSNMAILEGVSKCHKLGLSDHCQSNSDLSWKLQLCSMAESEISLC